MASPTIRVYVKQPHSDRVAHEVAQDIAVKSFKEACGLVGANLRYKGRPLKNGDTLDEAGVQADDEIHAFPPSKEKPDAAYFAQRRLNKGVTKRSIAHQDLHRETQSVVMDESNRICGKLDKLIAYHEQSPGPSKTYPVDHQAIRTDLERSGLTPTQLIQLFRAANAQPPTRIDKNNKAVVDTTKYLLAERICSIAGSGAHEINDGQVFDYHTLNAWMLATRHRLDMDSWQPPVASCIGVQVEQPRAKRSRKNTDPPSLTAAVDAMQQKRGGLSNASAPGSSAVQVEQSRPKVQKTATPLPQNQMCLTAMQQRKSHDNPNSCNASTATGGGEQSPTASSSCGDTEADAST